MTLPILACLALAVSIIAFAVYISRAVRDYTEKEADSGKTADEMTPEELFLFGQPVEDVPEDFEPPLEEVNVTVSVKRCGTRVIGTKSVHAVRGFFITFTDEAEQRIREFAENMI